MKIKTINLKIAGDIKTRFGLSGNIIFLFVDVVRIEKAITDSYA
jgi:hypothetical protein